MEVGSFVIVIKYKPWEGCVFKINSIKEGAFKYACEMVKSNGAIALSPGYDVLGWPGQYLRLATDDELTSLGIVIVQPASDDACKCSSNDLFNFGCNCGGK